MRYKWVKYLIFTVIFREPMRNTQQDYQGISHALL